MCFHSQHTANAQALKNRFKARFQEEIKYSPSNEVNGFTHPNLPIVTNEEPNALQLYQWGLLPQWAKDEKFQQNTLNAKLETIAEKPSFKAVEFQRCLIPATGFYEWKWLDGKGKSKEKYLIQVENSPIFCFAGLWSKWIDPLSGILRGTYTILTTEANPLMAEIHNSKKRMPVILDVSAEEEWLLGKNPPKITTQLIAESLEPPMQFSLF
jgi:putative SOS response-associated peptidase YedK